MCSKCLFSAYKVQAYHCFWSKVTSNQLYHNKCSEKFTVYIWVLHHCQSNRDVWRESEVIYGWKQLWVRHLATTSRSEQKFTGPYHPQFSLIWEAVPGRVPRLQTSILFFHPKTELLPPPLQDERWTPTAAPSFWAHCSGLFTNTFLNGCLKRYTKLVHD